MGRTTDIRGVGADVSPRREMKAMLNCEHCTSQNVRWFTPRSYAHRAAVLLCMTCRRLTIVSPHARRTEAGVEAQRAA